MTHASIPADIRAQLGIGDGWCACRWVSKMSKTCGGSGAGIGADLSHGYRPPPMKFGGLPPFF
ncbi:hypothetical protein QNM99_27930 [Pseudomonas sp. PCH446]